MCYERYLEWGRVGGERKGVLEHGEGGEGGEVRRVGFVWIVWSVRVERSGRVVRLVERGTGVCRWVASNELVGWCAGAGDEVPADTA